MDLDGHWAENKAKERRGQNFIRTILELSGYKVMNYGIENHNMEIIRMIKGNYESETNRRLMCMPDFVVVDPDTNKAELVEVKYRNIPEFDWRKTTFIFRYHTIHDYMEYWKDLTLIIALNVKPFCICVKMDEIDWNIHFKQRVEGEKGRMDEIWNFSGLYKLINEVFPRVTQESFLKAKSISHF